MDFADVRVDLKQLHESMKAKSVFLPVDERDKAAEFRKTQSVKRTPLTIDGFEGGKP